MEYTDLPRSEASCIRCERSIFRGDTGWYHQFPVVIEEGGDARLVFMNRSLDCLDGPHRPEKEVIKMPSQLEKLVSIFGDLEEEDDNQLWMQSDDVVYAGDYPEEPDIFIDVTSEHPHLVAKYIASTHNVWLGILDFLDRVDHLHGSWAKEWTDDTGTVSKWCECGILDCPERKALDILYSEIDQKISTPLVTTIGDIVL